MTQQPRTPGTEAGRTLLGAMASDPCDCAAHDYGVLSILAIEAEARADFAAKIEKALPVIVHILGCPRWRDTSAGDCAYRRIHDEDAERRGPSLLAAIRSAAPADHEHYWTDAADDETGWFCTICRVTEYPERPPFGAEP